MCGIMLVLFQWFGCEKGFCVFVDDSLIASTPSQRRAYRMSNWFHLQPNRANSDRNDGEQVKRAGERRRMREGSEAWKFVRLAVAICVTERERTIE